VSFAPPPPRYPLQRLKPLFLLIFASSPKYHIHSHSAHPFSTRGLRLNLVQLKSSTLKNPRITRATLFCRVLSIPYYRREPFKCPRDSPLPGDHHFSFTFLNLPPCFPLWLGMNEYQALPVRSFTPGASTPSSSDSL